MTYILHVCTRYTTKIYVYVLRDFECAEEQYVRYYVLELLTCNMSTKQHQI